ncbi:MAG TPA: hypothetical protein VHW69_11150 [Rhizomicrobium sp.]|jgi:hypothetical protein|nr:hypothetical protein [Rhizomicrobium sp.]
MSEPPVEAQPDGVQARPARIGQRWLDLSIAGVAIVISLISLAVGFYNAQSQQRMVAATSWPFLIYHTMRVDERLTLRIANEGVGPARLKSLIVRYHGREAHGLVELLRICCGLPASAGWPQLNKLNLVWESEAIGLYRAGEHTDLIVIDRTPANDAIWKRLADARLHLKFEACYCSVLGDCWTSDLDPVSDPKPVNYCPAMHGYRE